MSIEVKSKAEEKAKEEVVEKYTKREFLYSNFKRTFTLPISANKESIKAQYINGILEITIAKREEAIKKPKRTINID